MLYLKSCSPKLKLYESENNSKNLLKIKKKLKAPLFINYYDYIGLTAECFQCCCILKSKPEKSLQNIPTVMSAAILGYFHNYRAALA